MSEPVESELLFFDTFSHENTEELNLDIVQFQRSVVIREVRVIPLGTQVTADVPGGKRLGATNPSSFKLDLFVNNLSRPNAATFEKIGVLDYKDNDNIQLQLDSNVPTDGLILKGWYSAVTMAVYGNVTTVSKDHSPPPPPPPRKQAVPVNAGQAATVDSGKPPLNGAPGGAWPAQPAKAVIPQAPIAHLAATLVNALGASLQQPAVEQYKTGGQAEREQSNLKSQVEINERGEAKFPDDRPSDELFQEYLRKKDQMKVERERQERERQERHRRVSRSRSKERSYSRGRSQSRSHSRSPSRSSRSGTRSRSRSRSGDRVHRSSDKEYRERPEYRDKYRDEGGREGNREQRRADSRERDTRSRERREGSASRSDPRASRKDAPQERKDSYDRDRRDRTPERSKSPRSRRSSRSLSRERERGGREDAYRDRGDRERTRDYYEKDRDYRDKDRDYRDYDKDRDYREHEKDRDYRSREQSGRERVEMREPPREMVRELPRDAPREGWPAMPLIKTDVPPPALPTPLMPMGAWQPPPQNNPIEIISTRDPLAAQWGGIPGQEWPQNNPPPQQPPPADGWPQQPWQRDGARPMNEWAGPQPGVYGVPEEVASEPGEIAEEQQMYPGEGGENPQADNVPLEDMYIGLSDGEIEDADAYSDISSDENFLENLDTVTTSEWPMPDDSWFNALSTFDPYHCEFTHLDTYDDPSLTDYEICKNAVLGKDDLEEPSEAVSICEAVEKFTKEAHHDSWIEAVDSLVPMLPKGLSYIITKTERNVLDILIDWCLEGLDINKAMAQPLVPYKIRHLKMGIRLAGALCCCDTYVALKLLTQEVQHKLLDVFESPNMSSSLKLAVIKALDRSLRFRESLEWFIGNHSLQQLKGQGTNAGLVTGYQRLVQISLQKQMARVSASLIPLLRKVHFFEVLADMVLSVERIAKSYRRWMIEKAEELAELSEKAAENPRDSEVESFEIPDLAPQSLAKIINGLQEVLTLLANSSYAMGQPKRVLPSQCVFEINQSPSSPLSFVLHLLKSCHFLECTFVLLSSPATFHQPGIFQTLKDILQELVGTAEGLQFLCSKPELTTWIIQCLTQTPGYNDESDEEGGLPKQPHPAHLLGLQMIMSLQTMQHIDSLQAYHNKVRDGKVEKTLDAAEPLGILHSLYLMTFTSHGRHNVLKVLGMDNHLDVLLPFICMTGDETQDIRIQRSVCHGYTVQLLLLLVRHSGAVKYLQVYGQQLLAFSKTEPQSTKTADKIAELCEWLTPLEKVPSFSYDSAVMEELVKALKGYADDAVDLPKGMVTTLRIMKSLCIPEKSPGGLSQTEAPQELKFAYAQIALFSADCMAVFNTILQKLGDSMTRPFQQDLPFTPHQRLIIYEAIGSVLTLMKLIVRKVIDVRGSEFKDMTFLPSLFNVHTMMCSFSHSGSLIPKLQQIQSDIVDILAAFTNPPEKEESEEALAKSLWTQMMRQLLQYILTAPYTYLGGLVLLSELLPLPLPLQTHHPLREDECKQAILHRQLWSAHLHAVGGEVHNLLHTLAFTGSPPLQQLLRRVAWQLADLGHPTALLITRCLLDTLVDGMDTAYERVHPEAAQKAEKEEEGTEANKEVPVREEVACSTETCKVLNLLTFLVNQPPIKTAFVYITSGRTGPNDEKYVRVLERMVKLMNVAKNSSTHQQAQEYLMGIFQSLCDLEMTLVPPDSTMTFVDQLANSLPPRDQMAMICTGLLKHMDNRDHHFSSVLPALRTLALLMLHDYGFYFVKCALENVPTALHNLFVSINAVFSKDSSDCIATLSSAIELLQFLVALPEAPEGDEQTVPFERTYLISYRDLREIVRWPQGESSHPLGELDSLLVEYAKEEESLRNVFESVNLVVSLLNSNEDQPKPEMVEPKMPDHKSIQSLFAMRQTFIISDEDDDRINPSYWLVTPLGEADYDDPNDGVKGDLIEMARKYCQDFNLIAELEKGAVVSEPPVIKLRRRTKHGRRVVDTINTSKARNGRGQFVAPMRGRGFGRGLPVSRSDAFRNRAPNTSRPPSMHVDDFIKMELQGGMNIGPTGMNPGLQDYRDKLYQGSSSMHNTGGGGSTGRGMPVGGSYDARGRGGTRGMFFTPPGPYSGRREPMRGGGGGMGMGSLFSQRGGMMASRGMMSRGRAMPGGHMTNAPKPPGAWYNRSPMDNRQFDRRPFGMERPGAGRFVPNLDVSGSMNLGRGGGWEAGWRGRDTRRYMPPPGNPNWGGGRDRGRHGRTMTK